MKAIKWAAVAVTALFALMNFGAIFASEIHPYHATALAVVGAAAALALGVDKSWGPMAVTVAGGFNVIAAIAALLDEREGAVTGIVIGGLGLILGALAGGAQRGWRTALVGDPR